MDDVAQQLPIDIDNRLESNIKSLELLGDSLLQAEDVQSSDVTQAYLQRKEEILGFNSLHIIYLNGSYIFSGAPIDEITKLIGVQDSLLGRNGVSFLDEQSILYSCLLYTSRCV